MSIHDALDQDFAPAWRPEPGGKLVGTVTDLSEREGYDGDPYPILTVRTESGEYAVHAFHTVLRNELARIRPQVGTELGIKYEGKKATGNGRGTYHSYRVRSTGGGGVDWSRYDDTPVQPTPAPTPAPAVPTMQETAASRFGDDVPFGNDDA